MALKCPHCGKRIPDSIVTAYSGKIGGSKTALRGCEYFRQLQAQRKHRGGGRPPKKLTPPQSSPTGFEPVLPP